MMNKATIDSYEGQPTICQLRRLLEQRLVLFIINALGPLLCFDHPVWRLAEMSQQSRRFFFPL
jgi:hypothetical protein